MRSSLCGLYQLSLVMRHLFRNGGCCCCCCCRRRRRRRPYIMCSSHGCMLDGLLADMLFMLIISGQGQVKQLLFDPSVCICFSDSSNLGAWEGLETFHGLKCTLQTRVSCERLLTRHHTLSTHCMGSQVSLLSWGDGPPSFYR